MNSIFKIIAFYCLCLVPYSCGYKYEQTRDTTISIPYVKGDTEGLLTEAIIKQIIATSNLSYQSSKDGDLTLEAKIVKYDNENIGFRFDRDSQGNLQEKIVPSENRLSAFVKISLIETLTGKIILGPTIISSDVDYDYNFNTASGNITAFSMGQLDFTNVANMSAHNPLYHALAVRIVNYIDAR